MANPFASSVDKSYWTPVEYLSMPIPRSRRSLYLIDIDTHAI